MRKSYFYIAFILLISQNAMGQSSASEQLDQLQWLTGRWERQNMKPGKTAHERWEAGVDNTLHGWGVSFKEQDTVFVEKLQIVTDRGQLFYVASVDENNAPVYFKMIEIGSNGFICENPEHDFPRRIAYVREGNRLKATISGDGKEIDFLFLKVEENK